MKALILSCNTGQGHNAAGKAVLENLLDRGVDCKMMDALSFGGERASRVVSQAYIKMATYRPGLFHMMYKAGDAISSDKIKSVVYLANKAYASHLRRYIEDEGIDTIITPHLFPGEALTYLKRVKALEARCYAIATDYTCTPFWEETELDCYFIPHEDLEEEFLKKGIPGNKIVATGIPVSKRFRTKLEKASARQKLGLENKGAIYLVMTGSMGFGNMRELVDELLAHTDGQIVVLGGSNEGLKRDLKERYAQSGHVAVIDFTDQVGDYMDACDVMFTKPGGLTSTEAAVKNVPLIHTAPIPGCETRNAQFFASRGLSIAGESYKQCAQEAIALAQDKERQLAMLRAQRKTIHANACDEICDRILSEAH